jgi:S1-C subfamily serine protease
MAWASGQAARRFAVRLGLVLGAAVLSTTTLSAAGAAASTVPPSQHVAAQVEPAVQLIQTKYTAELAVRGYRNNTQALSQLQQSLFAEQNDGQLANDLQSINVQWLTAISADANRYYIPTRVRLVRVPLYTSCSGFFATPSGYLVTAAHCVKMARGEMLSELEAEALPSFIKNDETGSIKNFQNHHVPLNQTIVRLLDTISQQWFQQHTTVVRVSTAVTVELAVRGKTLAQPGTKALPAAVVSSGTQFPGRDFAVLKVHGYRGLPSLALGDATSLQVGDLLYVDGFPGTVSQNLAFTAQSRKAPTFTEGPLNAVRTTTSGVQYMQTQAPAYEGNSGGPVLDAGGQVVGILIAGSVDPNTHQIVAGEEYVLPSGVLAAALGRLGVHATATPVTSTYAAALGNFSRSHYSTALQGFRQVQADFPGHPYAAGYARLARQQIAAGHDRTPRPRPFPWTVVAIGAGVLLVLILGVGGAMVIISTRRSAAPKPAPDPVTADAQQAPAPPMPWDPGR